jgi:hypothetical protein
MFARLLFLLLVALNLGAAAWLVFGQRQRVALPPITDPGVPALKLVGEDAPRPAPAAVPAGASTAAAAPLARDACATLGPFTTAADMRSALATLSPHVARSQERSANASRPRGYWVYLPATASREAALDEARRLAAKGINDYYVVTAGDAQNTVSLGLFDDPANAQGRAAQLQKLGFAATVRQRVDTEPVYWVDYAVPDGAQFDWTRWLPGRSDLAAKAIDCF